MLTLRKKDTNLPFPFLPLPGRAMPVCIGTINAAIARLRAQHCAATGTFIIDHSGIFRHLFCFGKPALRASDRGCQLYHFSPVSTEVGKSIPFRIISSKIQPLEKDHPYSEIQNCKQYQRSKFKSNIHQTRTHGKDLVQCDDSMSGWQ